MDRLCMKNRDFKPVTQGNGKKSLYTNHHFLTAAGALVGIGILIGLTPDEAGATRSEPSPVQTEILAESSPSAVDPVGGEASRLVLPLELPVRPADIATTAGGAETPAAPKAPEPADDWKTAQVRSGDSLSLIFGRLGLSPQELHNILELGGDTQTLKRVFPGEEVRVQTGGGGELLALNYDMDESRTLWVERGEDGFSSRVVEHPLERRVTQTSGIINDSLFLASQRAGLSDNLTMELAGIFGWDVDFSLDIRQGDRFAVVYEEVYKDGDKLRDGAILAAEFVNRGKVYRAVRYTEPGGSGQYYTAEGKSLRKAFLRSPVAFTRVSSGFSLGRMHPILNRIRSHKGVDYAAPTGTPVKSTGDGKIAFKGVKGGYGNVVIVQHGNRYSTLYGHLSGFARGLRAGSRVAQGQVIGYVGMTGLATGPHLHYEFHVDGVHRNPLTVPLPDAAPLPAQQMAAFNRESQPYLARLDALDRMQATQVAQSGAAASIALNAAE
ncbi:MAG: peptidoglycan DD-metalloendopeptidase family protein [Gammaproteobacteria bacterium]|nr:peptidoglycan DD-metalloendopeptidase family protein [Gammaproteobacteria bacterium]